MNSILEDRLLNPILRAQKKHCICIWSHSNSHMRFTQRSLHVKTIHQRYPLEQALALWDSSPIKTLSIQWKRSTSRCHLGAGKTDSRASPGLWTASFCLYARPLRPWASPLLPGASTAPLSPSAPGPSAPLHAALACTRCSPPTTPQNSPFHFCGNRAAPVHRGRARARRETPRCLRTNRRWAAAGHRLPPAGAQLTAPADTTTSPPPCPAAPRPNAAPPTATPGRCERAALRRRGGRRSPSPQPSLSESFRTLPTAPSPRAAHAHNGERPGAGEAFPTSFSLPSPSRRGRRAWPRPPRGGQRACAVARAAVSGEGLKSAGHAQCRFWPWRGGRHIGTAEGSAPGSAGPGTVFAPPPLLPSHARLASPGLARSCPALHHPPAPTLPAAALPPSSPATHAAAPGPRLAPLPGPAGWGEGAARRAVSGRRHGAALWPGCEGRRRAGGRGWIPAWPGSSPSRKAPRMRCGCRSGRPRRAWGAGAAPASRTTSALTPRRWTPPPPPPRPAATAACGSERPAAAPAAPLPRRLRLRLPLRPCWPDWFPLPPPAPRRWTAAAREGGGCRSRLPCLPPPPARRWSPAPRAPASPPRDRAAEAAAPPLPPAAPGRRRWLLPGCWAAGPDPGSFLTSTRTKWTVWTGTTSPRTWRAAPTRRRRPLPSSTSTTRAVGNERIKPALMGWITCSPAAVASPSTTPPTSSGSRLSQHCRAPAHPGRPGNTARACRGEQPGPLGLLQPERKGGPRPASPAGPSGQGRAGWVWGSHERTPREPAEAARVVIGDGGAQNRVLS